MSPDNKPRPDGMVEMGMALTGMGLKLAESGPPDGLRVVLPDGRLVMRVSEDGLEVGDVVPAEFAGAVLELFLRQSSRIERLEAQGEARRATANMIVAEAERLQDRIDDASLALVDLEAALDDGGDPSDAMGRLRAALS